MKRIILFYFVLLCNGVLWSQTVTTPQGKGTSAEPYLISSFENLYWISKNSGSWDSATYFLQTANIDASVSRILNAGKGFLPIGSPDSKAFRGIYDGGGYAIDSIIVNDATANNIGLFGFLGANSKITNLHVSGRMLGASAVGVLAGRCLKANIQNCFVSGKIMSNQRYVGGLVGYSDTSVIYNCHSQVVITAKAVAGGLIGKSLGSKVRLSHAAGKIVASGDTVGGFIGHISGDTTKQCFSLASVKGAATVGGFVGNLAAGTVFTAYCSDTVSGAAKVGVFVGNNAGEIADIYWDTTKTKLTTAFGINTGKIEKSYPRSTTEIKTRSYTTFMGWDFDLMWFFDPEDEYLHPYLEYRPMGSGTQESPYIISKLSHLKWLSISKYEWGNSPKKYFSQTADIDASSVKNWNRGRGIATIGNSSMYFQGIYKGNKHTIKNLYINRPTTAEIGFFGETMSATINQLYLANVQMTGSSSVGGLVGYCQASNISECAVSGTVTGSATMVGGLLGSGWTSNIYNSFTRVTVSGKDSVGGLWGYSQLNSSYSNCYAAGTVTGGSRSGGLLGYGTACTVDDSYWDKEVCQQQTSSGSTTDYAKSSVDMKLKETFVGWDFVQDVGGTTTGIWTIASEVNDGYPYFAWQSSLPAVPQLSVSGNKLQITTAVSVLYSATDAISVSSNADWLKFSKDSIAFSSASTSLQMSASFPKKSTIWILASNNTTINSRSATVSITMGDLVKTIELTQRGVIVSKTISNYSVSLGKATKEYQYSQLFSYSQPLTYSVSSSNRAVASITYPEGGFGFLTHSPGSTTITLTASAADGASASIQFKLTVLGSVISGCNVSIVGKLTMPQCAGSKTGAILVNVSGGSKPYRYSWSTTSSAESLSNLSAGEYTVFVYDSLGCFATSTFKLSAPDSIRVLVKKYNANCNAADGSIALSVSGGVSDYTYQWSDNSVGDSISKKAAGVYSVSVTDQNACSVVKQISLSNVSSVQLVVDSVTTSSCNGKNGAIGLHINGSQDKLSFLWNDNSAVLSRSALAAGDYTLTVTDANNCKAVEAFTVGLQKIQQPQIALVTVSKLDNKNLVVWERPVSSQIKYYTVYRQNTSSMYDSIGAVPYSDVSVFSDTAADPRKHSWRYKISATDVCGNNTELSTEYKTMRLIQKRGVGTSYNLLWDSYEGVGYSTFYIYRNLFVADTIQRNLIDSVAANVFDYTDLETPANLHSYTIAVKFAREIDPKKFKTDTGPFSQSLSNMSEASLVSSDEHEDSNVRLYPNPCHTGIKICDADAEGVVVSLLTSSGSLIAQASISGGEAEFSVRSLPRGLYLVQMVTNNHYVSKTICVE